MNNFDLRKYLAEGKLKASQEKVEEVKNIPDDIKWEFDDVIDQMDAYNATIALTGHSKSTGKNYTASAEASRGGEGGDWDWMEVDEVEEETIAEEKRPDYPHVDKDGDTEESMEKALKDKEANLKEWGSSDWHYFLDEMHTDLGKPTDAPDIFKVLDVAGDAVDKHWDDWEEYETDREGLNMHAAQTYLKTKFPEYFKGMQALFAPMNEESIKESLRAWNVIDIDGNVTHEGLSYEEALAKAKEVEGHKIRPTSMMLDEDYDPDQEQLDDEEGHGVAYHDDGTPIGENVDKKYSDFLTALRDSGTVNMFGAAPHLQAEFGLDKREAREILANWMKSFKESLQEALNPEVVKAVNRLIKALAKKYDYPERDAVFAIQAALKQRGFDNVNEGYYGSSDIDNIVSTIGYDDIDSFFNDNPGAVDAIIQWAETVPDFERMLQDAGMIEEDLDLGHQDDEPGMLKGDLYKIGKYSMELYQMMDDLKDIHGEVDLPHWWQSKITTAKNMISGAKHYLEFELKEPAVDAMVTEDSLEDQAKVYFMQKVKRGEIDTLPEDPKAAFLAQMTKDQMDHDRETLGREGGLGEASFYTKSVKDRVVSKLMDQLKK